MYRKPLALISLYRFLYITRHISKESLIRIQPTILRELILLEAKLINRTF